MDELIRMLAANAYTAPGATANQVAQAERELGVHFPADYKAVLLWSNGCSSLIGDLNLMLWDVTELRRLNEGCQIFRYLPGVVGIGSDGGPKCFALDYRSDKGSPLYAMVPFGDLDFDSMTVLGSTLQQAIEKAEAITES